MQGVLGINRKDYNQKIRKEIEKKFSITLSPEALRRLIAPLRKEMDEQATHQSANTETAAVVSEEKVSATLSRAGEKAGQALSPANNFFHTAGLLVLNLWIAEFVQTLFEANLQFISLPGDDEKKGLF